MNGSRAPARLRGERAPPAIIYDALDGKRVTALLALALDRFAIDGADDQVQEVAAAAERFLLAVRQPALVSMTGAPRR